MEQRKGQPGVRELRWLHHALRLVLEGQCQAHARSDVAALRWVQRRKLAVNPITQRPVGWAFLPASGERF
ncbi:hypothetical protein FZX09_03420 [Synechococcus sp. MU1643]|nr:hypothetical protein [Synechococcus sp. MU1643]